MGTLNSNLRTAVGKIKHAIAKVRGDAFTYTIITDFTTTPLTELVLNKIFMDTTVTKFDDTDTGGRRVTKTEDTFFVSREALKDPSGNFLTPTESDSFVEFGTTAPVFKVISVEDISRPVPGFELTVQATKRIKATG